MIENIILLKREITVHMLFQTLRFLIIYEVLFILLQHYESLTYNFPIAYIFIFKGQINLSTSEMIKLFLKCFTHKQKRTRYFCVRCLIVLCTNAVFMYDWVCGVFVLVWMEPYISDMSRQWKKQTINRIDTFLALRWVCGREDGVYCCLSLSNFTDSN